MTSDPPAIGELAANETRHLTAPFAGAAPAVITDLETLPYAGLGGPGLERLCYEILLSKGYEPRFFGRNGQAQYGIDLVAEKDGRFEVYQCKNLQVRPKASDLKGFLATFEDEWLRDAGLPHPTRFVICCPALLRDSETDSEWLAIKTAFQQRTGIEAALWHLDLLNGWLKKLPDIVADVFSDRHAENFCDADEWDADLFKPLREGASGDRRLRRYFESRKTRRLYVDEPRERKITEALERSPVILIRGLPGTGKTFTALAVAERLRDGRDRTYFIDAGSEELTRPRLRSGIRNRIARRSVFVLENCHERIDAVAGALDDLAPLLASGRASVICLARRVPGSLDNRSDDWTFYSELEASDAAIDFENDDALLRRVVQLWRPEFVGLAPKRLAKLVALCGRDLFLLDEVLRQLASPTDIDELSPSTMYDKVRVAYLGHKTADNFAVTRRLAALAQFDIHPRADVLQPSPDELALLENFGVRAGQPPHWHFLHSTAAELMLHAIWSGMGVMDDVAVALQAATDVSAYFRDVADPNLRPPSTATSLRSDLRSVMRNTLKLTGIDGARRLRAAVLDSEPVREMVARFFSSPDDSRMLSILAFSAHTTAARSAEHYAQLLHGALQLLLRPDGPAIVSHFGVIGLMLRTLETVSPELHAELNRALEATHLLDLVEANGSTYELFQILHRVSAELAWALVNELDDARIDRLVERTIASGRSVGTTGLYLRELARRKDLGDLARTLDQKIGAVRMLRMIEKNGTMRELLKVLPHLSPAVARGMVAELDEERLNALVDKTIAEGRSIGTISFALRELRQRDRDVARDLGEKIGADRFLRLIENNGTLFELFKIVADAPPTLAKTLIQGLAGERMTRLIQKTISTGRSIGTLAFALRSLEADPRMVEVARELRRAIRPADFLQLVQSNGTIFELFRIVQHVPLDFARDLVDALTEAGMNRLIDKTVAAGRSIGTLNYTFRALRRAHGDVAAISDALERKLGVGGFWRLMIGNGTAGPFVDLLRDVSPAFREQIYAAASGVSAEQWDRIIARGDFMELCELISTARPLFEDAESAPKLIAAVAAHAEELVESSNWLERRGGSRRLASSPDSPERNAAAQALERFLAGVDPWTLSFESLREGINAASLLHQERADLRPVFPALMRTWFPAEEQWTLDAKKDTYVPRILLWLLANPEFSDDDADEFVERLLRCFTRELFDKLDTQTALWTLWAMFVFARTRDETFEPRTLATALPSELVALLNEHFAARVAQRFGLDERRTQMALLGLLTLFGIRPAPSALGKLQTEVVRYGEAVAWRFCADQTFVTAWLALHGVEFLQPLPAEQRAYFREHLLSAAEEYTERDAATEYLYRETAARSV